MVRVTVPDCVHQSCLVRLISLPSYTISAKVCGHLTITVEHPIPDLVLFFAVLVIFGDFRAWLWGSVRSRSDFHKQFIIKVFSGVDVRALCRTLMSSFVEDLHMMSAWTSLYAQGYCPATPGLVLLFRSEGKLMLQLTKVFYRHMLQLCHNSLGGKLL